MLLRSLGVGSVPGELDEKDNIFVFFRFINILVLYFSFEPAK